jgi:hypothetical protein
MSHRSADDLSETIDRWLSREGTIGPSHLAEFVEALSGAFPTVADDSSRERVRRRLAGYSPTPKSPQQLLIERAVDEIEFLQRRLTGEQYVPWPAVVGAAAMVVGTVALAVWLKRRGIGEAVGAA